MMNFCFQLTKMIPWVLSKKKTKWIPWVFIITHDYIIIRRKFIRWRSIPCRVKQFHFLLLINLMHSFSLNLQILSWMLPIFLAFMFFHVASFTTISFLFWNLQECLVLSLPRPRPINKFGFIHRIGFCCVLFLQII